MPDEKQNFNPPFVPPTSPELPRTDLTPTAGMAEMQAQLESLKATFAKENAALRAQVTSLESVNAKRVAGVVTVDFVVCNTCGDELEVMPDETTMCPKCGLGGIVNHVGTNPSTGALMLVKQEQPFVHVTDGLVSKRVEAPRG